MLNKNNERELAYVVIVDEVVPIPGRDKVECAKVGGWTCMVPKGAFHAGDPGIYFEIDSQVPLDNPVFEFCAKYKGHIKTQKFKTPEGQFWSQGLLMSATDFGWTVDFAQFAGDFAFIVDDKGVQHIPGDESAYLTKQLGVTYYEPEDNKRKSSGDPNAKYKRMAAKHPKLFQNPLIKKIYKTDKGKKILFFFFGRGVKKKDWPYWVKKTDEERLENMKWILESEEPFIATEKYDGTSTTVTMKRKRFGKNEFYVCSRNVVFDSPDKQCYYETNVYQEMADKYHLEEVCNKLLDAYPDAEWVTIQGETFGAGVQKRTYGRLDKDFRAFNLIFSHTGRLNTMQMIEILKEYGVPCVYVIDANYKLPKTVDEVRAFVHSQPSIEDGGMREGIVFRSQDALRSFKCVDPEYLIKYHG